MANEAHTEFLPLEPAPSDQTVIVAHAPAFLCGRPLGEILVETTAGQGACLGWRFEQVAAIRDAVPGRARRRVAVCVDTCHVWSAGYDIGTDAGYARTIDELDRTVGLRNVEAFHLNDSKKPKGCRVDRHEHIGQGTLGLEPFRNLVNDPRFAEVPGFVETDQRFKENIEVLRGLVRR